MPPEATMPTAQELTAIYAEYPDDQLTTIAGDDGEQYGPEAIAAARTELRRRRLPLPAPRPQTPIEDLQVERAKLLDAASNSKWLGGAIFIAGAIASAGALYFGGGYIWYGAVFAGFFIFTRGLDKQSKAEKIAQELRRRGVKSEEIDKKLQ